MIDPLFKDVIEPAQATQKAYGIPASVTLAQWALESNYGKAEPAGSNNPFGIKAKQNQPHVQAWTHEVINGSSKKVPANFAKYESLTEAFEAHAKVLHNGRYNDALKHEADPDQFCRLMAKHYATDPEYASKLIMIMRKHALYQYNHGEFGV